MKTVMESGLPESDTPLSPVPADDLRRVWGLIQNVIAEHGVGTAIHVRLISPLCSPGTNVNAVFFRAALLQHMLKSGRLNDWRDGNEPAAFVFRVAATIPLERGVRGFDPEDFVERLRSEGQPT